MTRFCFIRDNQHDFCISAMCRVFGVSRSGYYEWLERPASTRAQEDQLLKARIHDHFHKSRQTYGTPRLKNALKKEGRQVSQRRIGRLMKEDGLVAKATRRFKPKTTQVEPRFEPAPNLLEQDFSTQRLNEVWLADLTYVKTAEGWLYVSTVIDLHSRRIIGWAMGDTLEAHWTLSALQMALERRMPKGGLIHHSDRGSQYSSHTYQNHLTACSIKCSMSAKGNCYDNAPMESFFGTLKIEVDQDDLERMSRAKVRTMLFDYIEVFYNRERAHSSLGFLSPVDFENALLTA